jgi:hypothetical protein
MKIRFTKPALLAVMVFLSAYSALFGLLILDWLNLSIGDLI